MRHVAEGDLHAYLDGGLEHYPPDEAARIREHLDACAPCRDRLAEERRSRERAASVLAGADPGAVETPPFEELRRRALAREGPDVPRRASGPSRVGWLRLAATAVVALGVGWMGGRILPAGPLPSAAPASDEAEAPRAAGGREGPGRATPAGVGARSAEQAATVEEDAAVPERLSGTSRGGPPPPSGRTGEVAPRQRVAGADPGVGAGEPTAEGARGMEAPVSPSPESPALALEERIVPAGEAREAVSLVDAAARTGDSTIRVAVEPEAVESGEEARAERRDRVLTRSGVDPFAVSSDVSAGARRALEPSAGVRARDAESLGLAVPGLPVVRVEWTEVAPGAQRVRVVQLLLTGDTLDLRFGGLDGRGDAPTALLEETLTEGTNQVLVERGAGWVVARAPLAPEEIRALIARLR